MAIPYSNDLRKKAIDLIKKGKKQTEIAELLSIDKATIFRWNKRVKEIGNADLRVITTIVIKLKSDRRN